MRIILILAVTLFSINAIAFSPMMSVKERLRILLWIEGLEEGKIPKVDMKKAPQLPEELEKPLRNL